MRQERCERCGRWHDSINLSRYNFESNICEKCHFEIEEAERKKQYEEERAYQDFELKSTLESEAKFRTDLLWLQNSNNSGKSSFFISKYESEVTDLAIEILWSDFTKSRPLSILQRTPREIRDNVDKISDLNDKISSVNGKAIDLAAIIQTAVNAGSIAVGLGVVIAVISKTSDMEIRLLFALLPFFGFAALVFVKYSKFKKFLVIAKSHYDACISLSDKSKQLCADVLEARLLAIESAKAAPGVFASTRSAEIFDNAISHILKRSQLEYPSSVQITSDQVDQSAMKKLLANVDLQVQKVFLAKIENIISKRDISVLEKDAVIFGTPANFRILFKVFKFKTTIASIIITVLIIANYNPTAKPSQTDSTQSSVKIQDSSQISKNNPRTGSVSDKSAGKNAKKKKRSPEYDSISQDSR